LFAYLLISDLDLFILQYALKLYDFTQITVYVPYVYHV